MGKNKPIKPVGKARGPGSWEKLMQTKSLPTEALVYEVRATDGKGNPVTVRYKNIDDGTGMLYIGELADTARVNDLLKGFHTKGKIDPHGAATKYLKEGLDKRYPIDQLEIRVTLVDQSMPANSPFPGLFDKPSEKGKPSDGKVVARIQERGLLFKFKRQYGRLPPLNKKKGYHTKSAPLSPSPGEIAPVGNDPVQMESISEKVLKKAKADFKAKSKKKGNDTAKTAAKRIPTPKSTPNRKRRKR